MPTYAFLLENEIEDRVGFCRIRFVLVKFQTLDYGGGED